MGFKVQHGEGYHTYWKEPGIVGYPLQFTFRQPQLDRLPVIDWAYPERVSMKGHPAHGFKRDVVHSFSLEVPLAAVDVFVVDLDVAWMACAENCFPQNQRFRIEVPIGSKAKRSKNFEQLQVRPVPNLQGWKASARLLGEWYEVALEPSNEEAPELESIYLFSEDGQLTSSFEQHVQQHADGKIIVRARASGIVDPAERLPCLLYAEKGLGEKKFVRISPQLKVMD